MTKKIITISNSMMILGLSCMMGGCIWLRGTEKQVREELSPLREGGNQYTDGEFDEWEKSLWEIDGGNRVSFGLVPGLAEVCKEGTIVASERYRMGPVGNFFPVSIMIPFSNVFLLTLPTWLGVAACFSDFDRTERSYNELTAWSLFGAHHWQVKNSQRLLDREAKETLFRKVYSPEHKVCTTEHIFSRSDGALLYLAYPGFDKLYAAVEAKGKADVMFQHGDPLAEQFAYRRFRLSKNVKAALTFEDIGNGVDAIADKEIKYRREISQIKLEIEALTEHPGYKCCSEELRKAVNELTNRVGLALNQLSSEAGNTAEKLKLDATSINERLEKACQDERVRLQKKAEEERVAALKRAEEERAAEMKRSKERRQRLIALKKSFEEDLKKADEGDVEAQFRVGNAYRVGNDVVSKNRKLARKYLRKAYDGGCEKAWDALEALQTP